MEDCGCLSLPLPGTTAIPLAPAGVRTEVTIMQKRLRSIAILFGLASPLLLAQQGSIAGPVSGYVFDRTAHVLRPVMGIAGAAVLGDGVNFGMPLAAVYVHRASTPLSWWGPIAPCMCSS